MNTSKCAQDEFNEKYDQYSGMIFRLSLLNLKNIAEAEDVMQEVFVKLLYQAPQFNGAEHEKHWILRVTINLCKNRRTTFWQRKREYLEDYEELCIQEPETGEVLQKVMNLPEKYRGVIHLHYFEGYHVNEIAKIMNIGESTVKMRLKRGRDLLKIKLEEEIEYEQARLHQCNESHQAT